jgi:hypothetical protein
MITQPNLGKAVQGLNDLSSAVGDLKLGTLLVAMIAAHNQLQVARACALGTTIFTRAYPPKLLTEAAEVG